MPHCGCAAVGRIAATLLEGSLMHTPSAQSVPQPLDPDDPTREAVLRTATAPLREVFGDRVQLTVNRIDRMGQWVFLRGRMRDSDGSRPSYAGTSFAKAAAAGQKSDIYVALLSHSGGADNDPRNWHLADHRIGPTDVAWDAWPAQHAAPRALFSA